MVKSKVEIETIKVENFRYIQTYLDESVTEVRIWVRQECGYDTIKSFPLEKYIITSDNSGNIRISHKHNNTAYIFSYINTKKITLVKKIE